MQTATTATRAPAGKWVIAGTVVLGSFVSVMDISIVNVAMPQMISTFGVSLDAITWVAVLDSGVLQLPRMLIILVVTPIAGRLYNYLDSRVLVSIGVALMMWGYLDMSGFTLETSFRRMLPGFLLTGAGMSFMFGPMSAIVMRTVPLMLLTSASSLFTLFRRIGGNLGYALVASQVAHRTVLHRARLADHVTPYDATTIPCSVTTSSF